MGYCSQLLKADRVMSALAFRQSAARIDAGGDAPPSVVPGAQERPLRTTGVARVLHLINGEHYAGAERVQDLLAQCLPQCGFEVGFACVKPKQFAELRQSQNTPAL